MRSASPTGEEAEGGTLMTHPLHPLQHAERAEIIMAPNDSAAIRKIQVHFAKRRDAEFPGWREWYEVEIARWLSWQKRPNKRS